MPRRELKEALGALRQELESGEQIGPDDRDALVQAMQEIHEALDEADSGGEPPAGGPLSRRVSALIEEIAHPELDRIVLGHLSSDCNTPDIILELLRDRLGENGHSHVGLHCACQDQPSDWFAL